MEVKLHGTVDCAGETRLCELLTAVTGLDRKPYTVHEIVMKLTSPSDGRPHRLSLHHKLHEPTSPWALRQEGVPLRGRRDPTKPAGETTPLEAQVRPLLEAGVMGGRSTNALNFLLTLGAEMEYELLRQGTQFECTRGGLPILVTVTRVFTLLEKHKVSTAKAVDKELWYVEAVANVTESAYLEAVGVIHKFGGELRGAVELSPPP